MEGDRRNRELLILYIRRELEQVWVLKKNVILRFTLALWSFNYSWRKISILFHQILININTHDSVSILKWVLSWYVHTVVSTLFSSFFKLIQSFNSQFHSFISAFCKVLRGPNILTHMEDQNYQNSKWINQLKSK